MKKAILTLLTVFAAALLLFTGCGEVEENNNKITEKPDGTPPAPTAVLPAEETALPRETEASLPTEMPSPETDAGNTEKAAETPEAGTAEPRITAKPIPKDEFEKEPGLVTIAPVSLGPSVTPVPTVVPTTVPTEPGSENSPEPTPKSTPYVSEGDGGGRVIHFPEIPLHKIK